MSPLLSNALSMLIGLTARGELLREVELGGDGYTEIQHENLWGSRVQRRWELTRVTPGI